MSKKPTPKKPHQETRTMTGKRMTLDQINELKQEYQKLMPVVKLLEIKAEPDSFIGFQRDQTLRIMGYSLDQIAEMTRLTERDVEKTRIEMAAYSEEAERELDKINRENRKLVKAKVKKPDFDLGEITVIEDGPDSPPKNEAPKIEMARQT